MSELTVLVVGNDPSDLSSIRRALGQACPETYRILEARDLDVGLQQLEQNEVTLVLLDLELTAGRHLDSLVEIRNRTPGVPVLVLSGVDDEDTAIEAVRRGAQDYLVKGDINDAVILRVVRYAVERNKILSRLRALDEVKSQFVSTVSHEIRTPLAIIREFISLMHDEVVGRTTTEQKECLKSVLRQCDRLTLLLNDLLDLSRIESGKLILRRERTELDALLRRCVDDFRPRAASKEQQLTLEIRPGMPSVLCDPDRLLQVLVNLLGNAHKFTGHGGTIVIRTSFDEDVAEVEVADSGVGIGLADRQRVFDAFSQMNRDERDHVQGTGLGLAISKNIIDLHGGQISVDSTPGEGSCFTFTLPRYEDGAEFNAFIHDRLRSHDAGSRRASVIVLRCRNDKVTDIPLLKKFHACAGRVLRSRRDETLLVESKQVVIGLLESDPRGSLIALERIATALEDDGTPVTDFEYSLTELRPGDNTQQPLDPGKSAFRPLSAFLEPPAPVKVLAVDDDPLILRLIELELNQGFENLDVQTTTSGYEACISYGDFRPDLVILDLQIPDVDGEEILNSMMKVGKRGSKFLVVSAHTQRFERMLEIGCDDCLPKPLEECALVDKVANLLPEACLRDTRIREPVSGG